MAMLSRGLWRGASEAATAAAIAALSIVAAIIVSSSILDLGFDKAPLSIYVSDVSYTGSYIVLYIDVLSNTRTSIDQVSLAAVCGGRYTSIPASVEPTPPVGLEGSRTIAIYGDVSSLGCRVSAAIVGVSGTAGGERVHAAAYIVLR